MNKTIELKRAISDIGYKTSIKKGKGTALMSYSIDIVINDPPLMSLDDIHEIKKLIKNIAIKILGNCYDIYIKLKDHNGRNIWPVKEDRSDITPEDCADALRTFMGVHGLKHDKEKTMNNDKLYNLVCPKKNGKGNKAYLNETIHGIKDALDSNAIKDFDGITLIEVENGKCKELEVHEIVKIINPVPKTIVTWEIVGEKSIVKK